MFQWFQIVSEDFQVRLRGSQRCFVGSQEDSTGSYGETQEGSERFQECFRGFF